MPSALVMALVALSVGTAPAQAPHVMIDRAQDRDLPCAANASLEDALKLLAPDVAVTEGPPDASTLWASLRFDRASWQLRLFRKDGAPALVRELPGDANDCESVANASAVMVQRYFSEVLSPGESVQVAPLPPPAPPPPLLRRVSVAVGPTVRLPIANSASVGVELATSARLGRHGFAQLGAFGNALSDSEQVVIQDRPRGSIDSHTFSLWAAGGACLGDVSARSVCGGPLAGVMLISANASGDFLYQKEAQYLFAPTLGALVTGSQPLGRDFELSLSVRAGVPLTRTRFAVEGSSTQLTTPVFDAEAGVRIAWAHSF